MKLAYDTKLVRSFFLNLEETLTLVDRIVERACLEEGFTGRPRKFFSILAEELVRKNFQIIHKYSKSPIEILFLSTLHMSFAMFDPLHVEFTPPIEADTFPEYLRDQHSMAVDMWEKFQESTGSKSVFEFIKQTGELFKDEPHIEEIKKYLTRQIILYEFFGMYHKYHLSLQASFSDLKVNGRRIKPDMFIWIPSKPDFKLIVECDGYNTHSNKEAFSKDRAKDRELQRQGYKIFRFSGQDIYKDPVGQSKELFLYLMKLEGYDPET